VTGASFTPDAAAVHPALLVHGLAAAAERLGVVIHEGTTVTSLAPKRVETLHHAAHGSAHGTVRADVVLRATEGYTRDFPGERRTLIPLHSLMNATAPPPGSEWVVIGIADLTDLPD